MRPGRAIWHSAHALKTSSGTWRYLYDAFDNLAEARQYTSLATTGWDRRVWYRTDALLRRALVVGQCCQGYVDNSRWQDAFEERFFHDGDNVWRAERWYTALNAANPVPTRQWFTQAGPDDLLALTIADPAQMASSATRDAAGPSAQGYDVHTDDQGSVRAIADSTTGTVVAAFDYDTHGNVTQSVETLVQPFRWQGRELDRKTGLYHFRARSYDPNAGRFIQEDPLHFDAGDLNLYRFTWSNPRNWRDPSGMSASSEYGGTSGIAMPSAAALAATGMRVACILNTLNAAFAVLNDPSRENLVELAVNGAGCTVRAKYQKQKPPPPTACRRPMAKSFDGDTMVWIKDGLKQIRDVEVGDQVAAWNPETNAADYKRVTGRFLREARDIYRLTLRDEAGKAETVRVTGNHPYLRAANDNTPLSLAANDNAPASRSFRMAPGGEWTVVRDLKPGDLIRSARQRPDSARSETQRLTVVTVEVDTSPAEVYSLEVADLESFAVGELGAWAHNNTRDEALKKAFDLLGGKLPPGTPGKFGSPTWGDSKKGCRIDPGHPGHSPPEDGTHINWWDWTKGKRGRGGRSGAIGFKE